MTDCAMDAVDKLELTIKYDVKEWLTPTIATLIRRDKPMGIEDVKKIGINNVLKIASIRECLHYNDRSISTGWRVKERSAVPGGNSSLDNKIIREIQEAFGGAPEVEAEDELMLRWYLDE